MYSKRFAKDYDVPLPWKDGTPAALKSASAGVASSARIIAA